MKTWKASKRSWDEVETPITGSRRQDYTVSAGVAAGRSLLPQHAGDMCDSDSPSQRRLLPLYTPGFGATAEAMSIGSLRQPLPTQDVYASDYTSPRSHSVFELFHQQPKRVRIDSKQGENDLHLPSWLIVVLTLQTLPTLPL